MEGGIIVMVSLVLALGQPGLSIVNWSQGRSTSSSDFREGWGPSSLVVDDNDSDSLYREDSIGNRIPQCLYTVPGQQTTFWQVDLGQTVVLDHVVVIFRKGGPTGQHTHQIRRNGYSIIVSTTSTYLPVTPDVTCYSDTDPGLSAANHENRSCSNIGSYVTLYNQRNTYSGSTYSTDAVLELCEVKVTGCPVFTHGLNCAEDCPVNCFNRMCFPENGTCMQGCQPGYIGTTCETLNLSRGRSTSSSDYRLGFGPSSLVVDDNDSDSLYREDSIGNKIPQCLYTVPGQQTTFWQVNLGQTVVLDHVVVIFRKGGPTGQHTHQIRRNGYSIIVSTTSTYLPVTPDVTCYSDTDPGLSAANHENRSCSNIGSYVTVYNQRNTYSGSTYSTDAVLELCEVKVTGCPVFTHGLNCAEDCPVNCFNRMCFPGNGTCMQGCQPGYIGTMCETLCPSGWYGNACREQCGNCAGGYSCHHVHGRCPKDGQTDPCDPGWKGEKCRTEINYGFECSVGNTSMCDEKRACRPHEGKHLCLCIDGYYWDPLRQLCQQESTLAARFVNTPMTFAEATVTCKQDAGYLADDVHFARVLKDCVTTNLPIFLSGVHSVDTGGTCITAQLVHGDIQQNNRANCSFKYPFICINNAPAVTDDLCTSLDKTDTISADAIGTVQLIGILGGVMVILICVVAAVTICVRKRRRRQNPSNDNIDLHNQRPKEIASPRNDVGTIAFSGQNNEGPVYVIPDKGVHDCIPISGDSLYDELDNYRVAGENAYSSLAPEVKNGPFPSVGN